MDFPIETARLRLRKYEDRDLADILKFSMDMDARLDWEISAEGVKDYWEAQRALDIRADPQWFSLVVELKAAGKAIGQVGLGVIKIGEHRQGTIGWLLGRKYRGQGLATEAARALLQFGFEELGLHRIAARTGRDNVRSWKLMERLGMRREAHFRESHVVEGEWRDEYIYALLAEEWREESTANDRRGLPGRVGKHGHGE